MSREEFDKITEVEKFMMRCRAKDETKGQHGIPYDSMAYGEALIHWQKQGHPSDAYFSTDDPSMLEFAVELRKKFGLEIVSREEGVAREQSIKVKRSVVTGFDWARDMPKQKLWN